MNLPRPDNMNSGEKFPAATKGSTVFHAVRRLILLGDIRSGQPLVEQRLARDFNCSQGTVREALMRLQEEGLVDRRGYRGTIVAQTGVAEAVQMAKIRLELEVEGIRHAAVSFTKIELDQVEGILVDMEEATQSGDKYTLSETDRLFHQTIFRSSGLTALEPILKRCSLHMHLYTFSSENADDRPSSTTDAHRPILDALSARDPERAAAAMEAHIKEVIGFWAPPLNSAFD